MAENAAVQSLEALEQFSNYLVELQNSVHHETATIAGQLQRITHWIGTEQRDYWMMQFKEAERRFMDARQALAQCERVVRDEDNRSCTEQKKHFARAEERKAICERKLRLVKQCSLEWEHHLSKLMPRLNMVEDLAETQIPQSKLQLQQLLEPLIRYAELNGHRPPTKN